MSAQAEEVVASAATLADMAAQLDGLVARFVLQDQARPAKDLARPQVQPTGEAGLRRRAPLGRVA
jgi:hypothetical protein